MFKTRKRLVSEVCNIPHLGIMPFYSEPENCHEGEGERERMSEERAKNLDQEMLGFFRTSHLKWYERWKKRDLLQLALQTMPRQVEKKKIVHNLEKLKSEFEERLSEKD